MKQNFLDYASLIPLYTYVIHALILLYTYFDLNDQRMQPPAKWSQSVNLVNCHNIVDLVE